MDYFRKLNTFLDSGYKMTDTSCPICHKQIMYHPTKKEFFCVQCNMPAKFELEVEDASDGEDNNASYDTAKSDLDQGGSAQKKAPASGVGAAGTSAAAANTSSQSQQSANKNNAGSNGGSSNTSAGESKQNEDKAPQKKSEDYDDFSWRPTNSDKQSDMISKKLGEKLLQGWCMLEHCCVNCITPIMRSKSHTYACVNCGWSKVVQPHDEEGLKTINEPPALKPAQAAPVQAPQVKQQESKSTVSNNAPWPTISGSFADQLLTASNVQSQQQPTGSKAQTLNTQPKSVDLPLQPGKKTEQAPPAYHSGSAPTAQQAQASLSNTFGTEQVTFSSTSPQQKQQNIKNSLLSSLEILSSHYEARIAEAAQSRNQQEVDRITTTFLPQIFSMIEKLKGL